MERDPFIEWLQGQLVAAGFSVGKAGADGIPGRMTIKALESYQRAHGLRVTGTANAETVARLRSNSPIVAPTQSLRSRYPWMVLAYQKKGLRETDPALKKFLKSDGATLGDPARLPWCGDFVETIYGLSIPDEPLPVNPYLARNWLKFGVSVDPCYAATLVFKRPGSAVSGHVGQYVGETETHYRVLGGNQLNAVTDSALIAKNRLLGARFPMAYRDAPRFKVRVDGAGGVISTNEA